ncbi:MAG: choice-of-anchor Q domain-containing protein [Pseudolysinimonas sp.]|uniref:choice-of-anchor Q domain-containing protein n=1 Tax=Pseudolysinimonas sp. TaxID=2680009 RepID=UPI00326580DF
MTAQATSPTRTRVLAAVAALVLGLAGVALTATPASANTLTVTNENDSGAGSLRDAVLDANAGDEITFSATVHTITLLSSIPILQGLTITGPGQANLTITRGAGADFDLLAFAPLAVNQSFAIADLTIQGVVGGGGVGIHVFSGAQAPQNLTVTRVTIDGMTTTNGAAGLREDSLLTGTATITDSTFTNNKGGSGTGGGAVSLWGVAGATIVQGSVFDHNNAINYGGGALYIYRGAGTKTITDSTFTDNLGESGGAISIEGSAGSGAAIISNSGFGKNTTTNGGGAIYSSAVSLSIDGSIFSNNTSTGNRAGALYVAGPTNSLDITNSSFSGNSAAISGGALYVASPDPVTTTISGSTFSENSTSGNGGAIAFQAVANDTQITDSSFFDNTATHLGGALAVENSISGTVAIVSSTFAGNVVENAFNGAGDGRGTSIYVDSVDSQFTMSQSTIDDPESGGGLFGLAFGAVDADDDASLAIGVGLSTIVAPGVLYIGQGNSGQTVLIDNILSSSAVGTQALVLDDAQVTYRVTMSYNIDSDVGTYPWINDLGGNQFSVADPMLAPLADNGGPTFTRLPLAGSPAINLGDPAVPSPPSFDQRGTGFARISGGRVDIGSVEVQAVLAATGSELPWVPAGVALLLLVAGAGAVGIRRTLLKAG